MMQQVKHGQLYTADLMKDPHFIFPFGKYAYCYIRLGCILLHKIGQHAPNDLFLCMDLNVDRAFD